MPGKRNFRDKKLHKFSKLEKVFTFRYTTKKEIIQKINYVIRNLIAR